MPQKGGREKKNNAAQNTTVNTVHVNLTKNVQMCIITRAVLELQQNQNLHKKKKKNFILCQLKFFTVLLLINPIPPIQKKRHSMICLKLKELM